MGRGAFIEAKWHSFGQNILSFHENRRHLHVRNSRSGIPTLSQINPIHIIKSFQRIILPNFANMIKWKNIRREGQVASTGTTKWKDRR
jgi:hypothetical protein